MSPYFHCICGKRSFYVDTGTQDVECVACKRTYPLMYFFGKMLEDAVSATETDIEMMEEQIKAEAGGKDNA